MTKILAVFGATGQQGRSVVDHVLNDPELAQQYTLRAITRDIHSEKAKELSKEVEVVFGDTENPSSVENALAGAHTVFIMTVPSFGPDAVESEFNTAKMLADIAVDQGVKYIIFSTLPAVSKISGGKYTQVTPFDAKARAEEYIRSLPVKSSFCSLGSFMENLQAQKFLAPKLSPDGAWVYSRPVSVSTKLPLLNAIRDTGKFVGAILANPDRFEGKTLCAAEAHYSHQDIVDALSKSTGTKIHFKKVSWEDFRASLPWIPDVWIDAFQAQEEFGYFGPDGEAEVAWAASQARGKLTTLEEYLVEHPVQLE
ncbi:hypothetical protein V8F20_010231 [Naviculisporaceae sp. PSN 640]